MPYQPYWITAKIQNHTYNPVQILRREKSFRSNDFGTSRTPQYKSYAWESIPLPDIPTAPRPSRKILQRPVDNNKCFAKIDN